MLAFCAITLAGAALAPNLPVLDAAVALCCVTSVVVQMLVPYAATLASDNERSRVIGTLMGGLLIGILLSRTFAGVVAGFGRLARGLRHRRRVHGAHRGHAAPRPARPRHRSSTISYREQLRGVLDVARAEPALRWRSLIAACGFGSFACFWTTVTFLLSGPQYGFSQLDIGLFALVGAAGAITSLAGGPGARQAAGAALAGDGRGARAAGRLVPRRSALAARTSGAAGLAAARSSACC